ncbi:hypothetical protein JX265_006521 [Neoarthrinium moseri]|uniref:Uncharacterized protein n=1 Tax=Neoarthrinium moseri TaxID=1658444 RepID=A0A9P9WL87_9PEZI|nr:hypothetical protein JX266_000201 [Neoarthrinium moseri]KAI1869431.1 hypothetical protein JX265_006521 [Neoarthrinium moseri]
MEAAAKSIKSLASSLPDRPHHLSVSPDSRYHLHPNDTRLEEDVIRPLQYMTFLFDADRGLLLTRAHSDIRKEESHAPKPPRPQSDPNKPKTKLSLKDYKSRKQESLPSEGSSPKKAAAVSVATPSAPTAPKHAAVKDQPPVPTIKKENGTSAADSMLRKAAINKAHPSLPPKPDVRRLASPSPERKKRPSDVNDESRSAKRTKIEGTTPNATSRPPPRPDTPNKPADKLVAHDKKSAKELKPSPLPNGITKSATSNSSSRGVSPRPNSQVNGSQSQKSANSTHGTPKKEKPHIPPLLSPLGASDYPDKKAEPRPSPLKKQVDKDAKLQLKKPRDEHEPSSTAKKSRLEIPPLLSPTLPPIVREALAEQVLKEKKPGSGKEPSQKSSSAVDSPGSSAKKSVAKPAKEETIHVDSSNTKKEKREEETPMIVRLKYPKKLSKTVSRLLALAPKKKQETARRDVPESTRKDEHATRERSDSLEPPSATAARKRPRASTDVSEQPSAIKRPRTAEPPQPSTPSKHSSAMQRVASSSSQAGTPGGTNVTPAGVNTDRRSASVDPERANRLRKQHSDLVAIGTKLKHKRDRIVKPRDGASTSTNPTTKERNAAMAAVIQSTVAYMTGFKAQDEAREAERKQRDASQWRSLMPLMRVYKSDCMQSSPVFALFMRLHAISLVWYSKTLVAMGPENANTARELFGVMREQEQAWRLSEESRRKIDGGQAGDDPGPVARMIDRLGPWSQSEDVVMATVKILKKAIRLDDEKFMPEPDLLSVFDTANGS